MLTFKLCRVMFTKKFFWVGLCEIIEKFEFFSKRNNLKEYVNINIYVPIYIKFIVLEAVMFSTEKGFSHT